MRLIARGRETRARDGWDQAILAPLRPSHDSVQKAHAAGTHSARSDAPGGAGLLRPSHTNKHPHGSEPKRLTKEDSCPTRRKPLLRARNRGGLRPAKPRGRLLSSSRSLPVSAVKTCKSLSLR